jgi:hypothetical protein
VWDCRRIRGLLIPVFSDLGYDLNYFTDFCGLKRLHGIIESTADGCEKQAHANVGESVSVTSLLILKKGYDRTSPLLRWTMNDFGGL